MYSALSGQNLALSGQVVSLCNLFTIAFFFGIIDVNKRNCEEQKMIRIAICDDDIQYLKRDIGKLVCKISAEMNIEVEIKLFSDGNKLIDYFKAGKYFDIVILDIAMPEINGKILAEQLRAIDSSFYLAFLTSYKMEVFDSIKYNFNAFIPKDFEPSKIEAELKRVINDFISGNPESELFEITREGLTSFVKIPITNILFIYLSDKQLRLRTLNEELLLTERGFSTVADKFRNKGFYEPHRNYLVNVGKITEICDNYAILCNGERIPVSKRAGKGLIQAVANYILMEEAY